jgi:hypothetical protein
VIRLAPLRTSTGRLAPLCDIELKTKRESFLQVLDEDANLGGHPAARGPDGKDRHGSFKRSEKTFNRAFSEFCSEEPCWSLSHPQMLNDAHPHLLDVPGPKGSCRTDALFSAARHETPWLCRTLLDKNDGWEAANILRRFRRTVTCDVLRSRNENDHCLPQFSRNQRRVARANRPTTPGNENLPNWGTPVLQGPARQDLSALGLRTVHSLALPGIS